MNTNDGIGIESTGVEEVGELLKANERLDTESKNSTLSESKVKLVRHTRVISSKDIESIAFHYVGSEQRASEVRMRLKKCFNE